MRRIPRVWKVANWRMKRAQKNQRTATHAAVLLNRQSAFAWWLVGIYGGILVWFDSALSNTLTVVPNTCDSTHFIAENTKALTVMIKIVLFGIFWGILAASAPSIFAYYTSIRNYYYFPRKNPISLSDDFEGVTEASARNVIGLHLFIIMISAIITGVLFDGFFQAARQGSPKSLSAVWSAYVAACPSSSSGEWLWNTLPNPSPLRTQPISMHESDTSLPAISRKQRPEGHTKSPRNSQPRG